MHNKYFLLVLPALFYSSQAFSQPPLSSYMPYVYICAGEVQTFEEQADIELYMDRQRSRVEGYEVEPSSIEAMKAAGATAKVGEIFLTMPLKQKYKNSEKIRQTCIDLIGEALSS